MNTYTTFPSFHKRNDICNTVTFIFVNTAQISEPGHPGDWILYSGHLIFVGFILKKFCRTRSGAKTFEVACKFL